MTHQACQPAEGAQLFGSRAGKGWIDRKEAESETEIIATTGKEVATASNRREEERVKDQAQPEPLRVGDYQRGDSLHQTTNVRN